MPQARLSIIIPTLGRPTLRRTLQSIRPQCAPNDEVIVVADRNGDIDSAREQTILYGPRQGALFHVCDAQESDHGYPQRNAGMQIATGKHLVFIDDDDEYVDNGLVLMGAHAADRPVIFKMQDATLGVLWKDTELRYGNVGTPMFVVPNDRERLGTWRAAQASGERRCGGDFAFIEECVEKMGEPIWRPEIVARVRPHLAEWDIPRANLDVAMSQHVPAVAPMRVVVPYTNLRGETRATIDHFWPAAEYVDVSGSDDALWGLWRDTWARGEDVLWIEHDIVPNLNVLIEAAECPAPWCVWGYNYSRFGLYYGTGCVRIRGELMRAVPRLWDRVEEIGDTLHPAKHWCALDARMQGVLLAHGYQQHQHGTVDHLSVGCAHGCVVG